MKKFFPCFPFRLVFLGGLFAGIVLFFREPVLHKSLQLTPFDPLVRQTQRCCDELLPPHWQTLVRKEQLSTGNRLIITGFFSSVSVRQRHLFAEQVSQQALSKWLLQRTKKRFFRIYKTLAREIGFVACKTVEIDCQRLVRLDPLEICDPHLPLFTAGNRQLTIFSTALAVEIIQKLDWQTVSLVELEKFWQIKNNMIPSLAPVRL